MELSSTNPSQECCAVDLGSKPYECQTVLGRKSAVCLDQVTDGRVGYHDQACWIASAIVLVSETASKASLKLCRQVTVGCHGAAMHGGAASTASLGVLLDDALMLALSGFAALCKFSGTQQVGLLAVLAGCIGCTG